MEQILRRGLCILLLGALALGFAAAALAAGGTEKAGAAPVPREAAVTAAETALPSRGETPREEPGSYVIRAYSGFVAIYTDLDEETPAFVSSVSVKSLRANDRALLEQGIPAATLEEAAALLEDFSG